jgi:hypothetical protein
MANIPPKKFFSLSKEDQYDEAIKRMNQCYEAYEAWKKLSRAALKHQIHEPQEIDRPDLLELKS